MSDFYREDRNPVWKMFVSALAGAIIGAVIVGVMVAVLMPSQLAQSAPNQQQLTSGQSVPFALDTPSGSTVNNPAATLINYDMNTYPVVEVVKAAGPAVVKVETKQEGVVYNFFGMPVVAESSGNGSGVIIDAAGYILTNNHVIENVKEISVILSDGRTFAAQVVGADTYTDLAVLKIDGDNLPVAELGDSDELMVGEPAIAIGNPYGFDNTVTSGIISALNRSLPKDDGTGIIMEGLIQTDTPINPGNSGGALLTLSGKVVGINTAIIADAQNIGFAIPINTAKSVAQEILQYGKVRRPYSGITEIMEVTQRIAVRYGLPVTQGLWVISVDRNSPATNAGISTQDIIIEINGKAVTSVDDLRNVVYKAQIGDKLNMVVVNSRDRKQRTVELVLGEI